MAKIVINREVCKGCKLCLDECRREAIGVDENTNSQGYHPAILLDESKCIGCSMCALICPDVAIEVYK